MHLHLHLICICIYIYIHIYIYICIYIYTSETAVAATVRRRRLATAAMPTRSAAAAATAAVGVISVCKPPRRPSTTVRCLESSSQSTSSLGASVSLGASTVPALRGGMLPPVAAAAAVRSAARVSSETLRGAPGAQQQSKTGQASSM